jgi:VCBS repeat-containing protein
MSIYTTTSPTTGGTLPAGITAVGGVVLDLIGINGARVTSQLSAGSLFSGFAGTATFTIGTQTGFTPAMLAALGGGLAQVAIRITLSDGDTAPGDFDYLNNTLLLDGVSIGSFSIPTQQTAADGTFVADGTGFGDNILSTGWWNVTDAATLASIYAAMADGELAFQLNDASPGDNYYDFTQGVNGGLVNVGQPPNISPVVSGAITATQNEDAAAFSVALLIGASDADGDPLTATGVTNMSGDASGITISGNSLLVDPAAYGHLALGDSEVVVYNYTISDGKGGSVAQTATVTIAGRNDAPTVSAAVVAAASEDGAAFSINLLGGATDGDDGAVLSASGVTPLSGDASGITIDGNELDVNANAYNYLAAGESEVVTFGYNLRDEHGATVAQTATVTITGANDAPNANNDRLGGGGVLRVGYYDLALGQGNAAQIEAIVAAGHTPVLMTDLSAADLAGIDILLVNNPYGNRAEYLARMPAISAAVASGMTLIIHDREVGSGEQLLPGSDGFTIVQDFSNPNDINFINDSHAIANGPGGALDDSSLDQGNFSNHGFAIAGSLPADADLILSTGNGSQIVTFAYSYGSGSVIYSTIPVDFYIQGDTIGAGANNIFGKAEEYLANLINYAATDLRGAPLADEDNVAVIDVADLLANDSDPDASDVLKVSGVSGTSTLGAAVTLNGNGTISYDPSAGLNHLAEGETVEDSFTYTISDGHGGSDTATVTFTVVGVNDAPSAPVDGDGPSGASISEHLAVGSVIGIDANATDPEGDTVAYFFRDALGNRQQALGFFTIDAATGIVTLATAVNFELATAHSLTIYASDGAKESSTSFAVAVTNVVEHLFTPSNDGTASNPIDFNALAAGAYDYDGAQYDALAGDDFVILPDLATSALPGHAWDYNRTFAAGAGNDVIQGGDGHDGISGGDGNDSLFGGAGDDRLVGAAGNDKLAGGDGSDKLTGSAGKDVFIFTDSETGTTKLGEHDTITDFNASDDKIDISALYDTVSFGGLVNKALNGTAANAYKVGYYSESGKTWLEGDVNGDGRADFVIEMSGSHKLKVTDFVVSSPVMSAEAAWNATQPGFDYDSYHRDAFWI